MGTWLFRSTSKLSYAYDARRDCPSLRSAFLDLVDSDQTAILMASVEMETPRCANVSIALYGACADWKKKPRMHCKAFDF